MSYKLTYVLPDEYVEAKEKKELWWSIFFSFAIVTLNLGYNDYLSFPIFYLIAMLVINHARNNDTLDSSTIEKIFIAGVISLIAVFLIVYKLDDNHSALSQMREFTFFLLICWLGRTFTMPSKILENGFYIAGSFLSIFIFLQFIQIKLGMLPLSIPQSWMMLDYGNSLSSTVGNFDEYVRPTGFYSEPSAAASVLLPAFYIALINKNKRFAILFAMGILATQSMLGAAGMVFCLFHHFGKRNVETLVAAIVCSVVVILNASERMLAIFSGEDLSFQWRVVFPLEYVLGNIFSGEYGPQSIEQLFIYAKFAFENASIFDNWPLFTIARLGLIGFVWIAIVIYCLPKNARLFFLFSAAVTGAPLYHDKALLIILFCSCLNFKKQ